MTKYVGTVTSGINKARVRHEMIGRADEGEFMGMYMALRRTSQHGMPSPVDGGTLGGRSRLGLDIL